jgi:serine/threonine-protein kinase
MSEEFVMKQALSPETPARVRRQLRAFTLGIGASALAMACSFGEIDGEKPFEGGVDAPVNKPTPAGQIDDGTTAQPGTPSQPVADPAKPAPATPGQGFNADDPFQATILGQQVKGIIEQNCAQCHANGVKSGDMDYITDFASLVKNNKVVPGVKEDSQLYNRMLQQSMPPAFQREQRPTFQQIDQVGQWIDELEPLATDACKPVALMTSDQQIEAMANDVARLDPEDQPFTRYLTVSYSSNAGACGRELDRQRYALMKGINSVSTQTTIGNPQPIDENKLIYRIDIRDYDWDRAIDLKDDGTILFDDAWDAIVDGVDKLGFAVAYTGDDADVLTADTATDIPFLSVNAFIQATENGDLYYSLIGGKANLFDFEKQVLKIDTVAEQADNNLMRAGFVNSGVSKQERVLNRFDSALANGYSYWISFDFDGGNGNGTVNGVSNGFERNVANESIFEDPLGFKFAGGEAIFNLPNGIQAYYVAAANGTRLAEAPIGVVVDPAQNNGLVTNGASCPSCHNAGMIPFSDDVRRYVEANKTLFDNETYQDVIEQYPADALFQAQTALDSTIHVNAVAKAGVPKGTPDPISRVYLDFQLGNITPELAAGELNVTVDELKQSLNLLNPQLQVLSQSGRYVDRKLFGANYLDSICVLQSSSVNTPVGCP